jgi:hypothetical protein
VAPTELDQESGQVWARQTIGDGWVVAYRLDLDPSGNLVVAELRAYNDREKVPVGGLPARLLRRVRFSEALDLTREALVLLNPPEQGPSSGGVAFTEPGRRWLGEVAQHRVRDDRFYAMVADIYAREVRQSRHATDEVAKHLSVSLSRAREFVRTARERGLLTVTRQGRAGGQLTESAREILGLVEEQFVEVQGVPSAAAFGTPRVVLGKPTKEKTNG